MASIDLEWVQVFDEIYKTANVSRAAERLDMTQGAASTALNKLRAYFGDPLFTRSARGMLPTPRAAELYPRLAAVRENLEQARERRPQFDPARAERTFRICMTDISEITLLPTLVNHLAAHAPGVKLEAEKISPDTPRRLEDGEVDLAVGFMPQLEAGFYQKVLFRQVFVALARLDHPRIATRLTRAAYEREMHIGVSASGTGHAVIDKMLAAAGVTRRMALKVPSFLGVAGIVAETDLIATVPSHYGSLSQHRGRVRMLALPFAMPGFDVKQHWHERFHHEPGNAWLRRTISELLPPDLGRAQVKQMAPRPQRRKPQGR